MIIGHKINFFLSLRNIKNSFINEIIAHLIVYLWQLIYNFKNAKNYLYKPNNRHIDFYWHGAFLEIYFGVKPLGVSDGIISSNNFGLKFNNNNVDGKKIFGTQVFTNNEGFRVVKNYLPKDKNLKRYILLEEALHLKC